MAAASTGSSAPMPRSFKLLDEIEREHDGKNPAGVSVGLVSDDDTGLTEFQGSLTVMSGSGGLVGRFLTLRVVPPQDYPKVPPTVKFVSKVNLPGVIDSSGNVLPTSLAAVRDWDTSKCMVDLLAEILAHCSSAPRGQPGEDETF